MSSWRRLSRAQRAALAAGTCGLILLAALMAIGAPGRSATSAPPSPARPFSLPVLGRPHQQVALSQYAGRPLIVNFFASWCGPCMRETPLLARFYRAHHGQVAVVGIDVNDSTVSALRFVARAGVRYPVGTDYSAALTARYGVVGIPQTFFLNARHRIVKRVFGAVTQADLDAGLARMR